MVFNPNFTGNIKFETNKLTELLLSTENSTLSMQCDANLHSEASSTINAFDLKLADVNILIPIPGLPAFVVLNTKLNARLDVTVDAAIDLNSGFSESYNATLGVKYLDNVWSGIYNMTQDLSVKPLEIKGSVNLTQKFVITPEVSLLLYGIIGPYFMPELWEQFNAAYTTPSLDWNASFSVGLDATVGTHAAIIGDIPSFSQTFPFSQTLWDAPHSIAIVSGNNQTGTAGEPLLLSLIHI